MKCSQCNNTAVIHIRYNGRYLCENHFNNFVEKRVKRELRKQGLPIGVIAVALSGGKDSIIACYILNELTKKEKNREVHAITVDEGIANYRNKTISLAQDFCSNNHIPFHLVSFKKRFNLVLDDIAKIKSELAECTYCGVLRRYMLNNQAQQLNASALATGHNLDDVAQTILMNFIRSDIERMARMAPHTKTQPGFTPRILPLRCIPEKEITLYAILKGFEVSEHECPYAIRAHRSIYRDFIAHLENNHPGSRHRILRSYLELEECIKKSYAPHRLNPCKFCAQPSSGTTCMTCKLIETIEHNTNKRKQK